MPNHFHTSEFIDRYLAGELSDAEKKAFEEAVEADPALAEVLDLHRSLEASLGDPRRRRLLDALQEVVDTGIETKPALVSHRSLFVRLSVAATVVLAAAVGVWWMSRPAVLDAPAVVQHPVEQQTPPSVAPAPQPSVTAPQPKTNRGPVAAVDRRSFTPNPALDPMVGAMVRGGTNAITVASPKIDDVLPIRQGRVVFNLAGQTTGSPALTLRIFNNSENDFIVGKTAFEAEVPVTESSFALKRAIPLMPGVYYAVLSEPGDEEPLLVVRFYAGKK